VSKAHTENAFETSIEAHLLSNGWSKGDARSYDVEAGFDPTAVMKFVRASQPDEWAVLVANHGNEEIAEKKFLARLATELNSRGVIDVLRRPVEDIGAKIRLAYFKPATGLNPDTLARYAQNRLGVYRQVHHSESDHHQSLDVVLMLNGLPVATAELKNGFTNSTYKTAIRQYQTQRNPADLIFRSRTVVHFAVDTDEVWMTTRLSGETTRFLPFNQGSEGPGLPGGKGNPAPNQDSKYRTAYLWKTVWEPDAWLDMLGRFVQVRKATAKDKKAGRGTEILFPRYHQWDAVRRLAEHARGHGPGRNYLVQHSAGSGKSNSIGWLAHRLTTVYTDADGLSASARAVGLGPQERVFHKVIVVTDRLVLDQQLQKTVESLEHKPGVMVRVEGSSQDLLKALKSSSAQIIVTTLQKFPVIADAAAGALSASRFAIVVDEAHSSTTGESTKQLKYALTGTPDNPVSTPEEVDHGGDDALEAAAAAEAAAEARADKEAEEQSLEARLEASIKARGKHPNLSFFAFTATPKPKTLNLFGERIPDPSKPTGIRLEPFHTYSMRQAIEEEFILDVLANYVTYATYYRLANGLGGEDPEVDTRKASSALARSVSLHPTLLKQKAQVIVEHFRQHTAGQIGGRAKAMIVTRSRLHAVEYKRAVDEYIDASGYAKDLRTLVAFSGPIGDPTTGGTTQTTEAKINGFGEKELPKRFDTDEYRVLIVAEKYQTGFDQPLLQTMYVDKKLDKIKAVQTLSRLNRTAPGKKVVFVLDFANDAEKIKDAFRPYYEQTVTEPTDPYKLVNLKQRIESAKLLDDDEMDRTVEALLRGDEDAHGTLNLYTDPAIERYTALTDADEKYDFRDALRSYLRLYAFLGQIVPYNSTEMERLYYYGKLLLPRLPKPDDEEEDPNLTDAALVTHIRQEVTGSHNLSLTTGDATELDPDTGDGTGRQEHKRDRLSEVIKALNERFGLNLTEHDAVISELRVKFQEDDGVRAKAKQNTKDHFVSAHQKAVQHAVAGQQAQHAQFFKQFFGQPDFKAEFTRLLLGLVYDDLKDGEAAA
jgi:type I restriction enzyme R subunit